MYYIRVSWTGYLDWEKHVKPPKNILNLANRMPARQKLILTPTSDSTNFALSHAERVPNMDLSFRLESSELC